MKPQTVLITGASGRIGQTIAHTLQQQDCTVHAHYFSSASPLQQLPHIKLHQADLRDPNQIKVLFTEATPLDAVIHCAAISGDGLVARTSAEQWRDVMQVNLSGTFHLLQNAQQCLPCGGRVILMGSRVGEHGNRGQAAYAASKAGVIALAQTAARECANQQIAINVLCPPFVPSTMANDADAQRSSQMLFPHPQPQDALNAICSAVRWLLSEEAKYVTGQVIHPDGRIGFSSAEGFGRG